MKLTEIKRKNIIDAAITEFRERGFLGAKTTNIAKRAGVSSRTLYNHFESKEDLFLAISEIMIERNTAMQMVPYDPAKALKSQLIEALKTYIAIITEPEVMGLNRMVISELLRDIERAQTFFDEMTTHDYPIRQLISEAMTAGALKKADPEYVTKQLLGLIKTFFFWPTFLLGDTSDQNTINVMEDCVDMLLKHYEKTS